MTSRRDDEEHRRAELVTALGAVRARIAQACDDAGRDPRTVTLIAVTKTFPASDVAMLVRIGVTDVGENRDQDAAAKVADTAALLEDVPPPRWHFVGRVQSRKAKSVATYADVVHSVDRVEIAGKLADAVPAQRRPLDVFIQVSLDADPGRGGAAPDQVHELAAAITDRTQLRLRGVMAIPPLGTDPDEQFARLAQISQRLRETFPGADSISAGMSDDLEAAIRHGSTHVRVGTALLGRREQVFG
ncbi:MAG TPA: YggS family pyridoxal phosphate-dependent enzyme [Jatrophihabitans sp.]|nr:YggS family pyridoxal phosphate-dependent enzyme [Jatrophihabitans sp.]